MYSAIQLISNAGDGGVSDTVNDIADTHSTIILALIGIIGTSVAALVYAIKNGNTGKEAAAEAKAANNAVNNVGPGEHRLYDMISMIRDDITYLTEAQREFASKGWAKLPADLADAPALTQVIRDLQHRDTEVLDKLKSIEATLIEHTEWEMNVKYEEIELLKRQAKYIQAEKGNA